MITVLVAAGPGTKFATFPGRRWRREPTPTGAGQYVEGRHVPLVSDRAVSGVSLFAERRSAAREREELGT